MRRRAREDFRTNISQRGMAEPWIPEPGDIDLARGAAEATGTCLAGVDLISNPAGQRMVLEVNAVPGWRALARVNAIDVAERLVTWIETHAGHRAQATG